MRVCYVPCPACGHELSISTTTEPTPKPGGLSHCDTCGTLYNRGDRHRSRNGGYCIASITSTIPVQLNKELNDHLEEEDNRMLTEWSARWQ